MVYRFTFEPELCDPVEAEASLLMAFLAAEGLHGAARVRLEAGYVWDEQRHVCVVEAGTKVGQDIACMFIAFLIREFGAASFTVRVGVKGGAAPEKVTNA